MTVVLGESLRSGPSASGATRKRSRVSFFLLLKKTVVQPSMISVFSQRLHAAARRAIGRFFLYEDISFYAVWDISYYQPMFML